MFYANAKEDYIDKEVVTIKLVASSSLGGGQATPTWSPPVVGRLKMNVDAGLVVVHRRVGCGAVVHDHFRVCLVSIANPVQALVSPPAIESIVVLYGLILCFNNVKVEYDCIGNILE
uniref:Uncharacterized protein n=1 Tax=Cannabis sativa TaxID=3483 RepID=A0A803PGW0_CANSA